MVMVFLIYALLHGFLPFKGRVREGMGSQKSLLLKGTSFSLSSEWERAGVRGNRRNPVWRRKKLT
jgi:hypothetical protein